MSQSELSSTAIQMRNCKKTFSDGTKALDSLNIELPGGDTTVFLGPSGCGKTTTLRIIAGLEIPDPGGEVWFDSFDVTKLPIERRNVGMVFQSYALFPNMNVQQNIGYGLKIRKTDKTEISNRVGEIMDMMDITSLRSRNVNDLSGGQRQRVALARAIIMQPRVLLLDEPLTALDALLRERLRVDIDELLRSLKTTTVYVTHDQTEAMMLGDRIVVMSNGNIEQIGTPRQIYLHPESRFVADFIGTMNTVKGRVSQHGLELPGGNLPWTRPETGMVEALFRPEAMRVVPVDSAPLRGTVSSAFFLGDRLRLIVDGVGDAPITVETTDIHEIPDSRKIGLDIDSENLKLMES